MEWSIITEFEAVINGVKITCPETYEGTFFIVKEIESKFNISINDTEFIRDIRDFVALAKDESRIFSLRELEIVMLSNIERAERLEDVFFISSKSDDGDYFWSRDMNKKITDPTKYTSIKRSIKENSKTLKKIKR